MMNSTRTTTLTIAIVMAAIVSCSGDDGADVADDATDVAESAVESADEEVHDLAATLRDNGLESVATAVEAIDISELTDSEEFTFLAPNDEAFQALDPDEMADLLADPAQITEVLRNHTIAERYAAADITDMSSLETEAGNTLEVSTSDDNTMMIGDATVVSTDIDVGGGTIHVVDRLLLP